VLAELALSIRTCPTERETRNGAPQCLRNFENDGISKRKRNRHPRTVLRLPDLDRSKSALLNSLTSRSSQCSYDHAIREFIDWYCSEPRLAVNKTVVTRYRIFLEQAQYASSTINLRLAAVRRLAYEASDAGLLSPDLAAGMRRVKGAKKHDIRLENWLTAEQGRRLLSVFDQTCLRGMRDYAIVAVLLGCGLRRAELASVALEHLQRREEHAVLADLIGKGGHVRTVPVPSWVEISSPTLACKCEHHVRSNFPRDQGRTDWQRGVQSQGDLGRRPKRLCEMRLGRCCATRLTAHVRNAVPRSGRRTRADTIPPWPCQRSDDRAVSRLQAAIAKCCE